jgi:gluconolactonase
VMEIAYPILSPNGCGLSPDNRTVYVADTESARLWAFDIASPGVLNKDTSHAPHGGRLLGSIAGHARFDSLAVTASGNICVATLNTGHITVFSPEGEVREKVKMPDTYPTNICFGGSDLKTAYITLSDSGRLGVMPWPEPGLKLHYA